MVRQEPRGSSPVLTCMSGCICSFKQVVKSRLVWRHGTLSSRGMLRRFQASNRVNFEAGLFLKFSARV